jgi:hypothetical protein
VCGKRWGVITRLRSQTRGHWCGLVFRGRWLCGRGGLERYHLRGYYEYRYSTYCLLTIYLDYRAAGRVIVYNIIATFVSGLFFSSIAILYNIYI